MSNTTLYKPNEGIISTQEGLEEDLKRRFNHIATCTVLSTFMPGLMSLKYILDVEGKYCDTACTDGYSVWVCPEYWNINNGPQKVGLMFHETLHPLWLHMYRFRFADHQIANIATDIRINAFLKSLSEVSSQILLPANPPGASIIYSEEFGEDSEEVIYNKLLEQMKPPPVNPPGDKPPKGKGDDPGKKPGGKGKKPDTGKGKKPDTGKGKKPDTGKGNKPAQDWSKFKSPGTFIAPPDKTPESEEGDTPDDTAKKLRNKWEQTQQSIAQAAKLKGDFPGNLIEELEETHARIDWKAKLLDFVLSTSATDISEEKFDTRFMSGIDDDYSEEMFIEAIDSPQVENIIFAKDTSGSMWSDWLSSACSEIQAAMRTVNIKRCWVLDVDADVNGDIQGLIQEYGPNDQIDFSAKGRGGTDFRPPFQWALTECPAPPKALVYFTDGHGPFPEEEPPFPTLWMTFSLDPEKYPKWKRSQVIDMRELIR